MSIQETITRFITFYQETMVNDIDKKPFDVNGRFHKLLRNMLSNYPSELRQTLYRLNTGDCGTATIAVGLVLQHKGHTVRFCENNNHAYLEIDGKYYDTLTPDGQSEESSMYGYSETVSPLRHNLKNMHDRWLPFDNLGIAVVEHFIFREAGLVYPFVSKDNSYSIKIIPGKPYVFV